MNDKKRIKKEVKQLAKQRKYEEIYYQYGPKYFREYVSKYYKFVDINNLRKEGRYIDIYTKYGKLDLETKIKERRERKGKKVSAKNGEISNIMLFIKGALRGTLLALLVKSTTLMLKQPIATDIEINNNKNTYREQIEEYEKAVEEYAKQFNTSEQSDLEIIMKCMYDLQSRIQGYKNPELDILGYLGLDVMNEGGFGVCRNFANNIADELNEINPEYNARTIILYYESNKLIQNNIPKRTIKEVLDIETAEIGECIIDKIGNEAYMYQDDKLVKKITEKEDTTIVEYYKDGMITRERIIKEDEEIKILYDNEQNIREKLIQNENEEARIVYDNNGKVKAERKCIQEEKDGVKYSKEYINGKLFYYSELTDDYYKTTYYLEDGSVSIESISDSNKEETYYYTTSHEGYAYAYLYTKIEDGYKTEILYDKNGKEEAREIRRFDGENSYIEEIKQKEQMEQIEMNKQLLEKLKEYKRDKATSNHEMVAVDIDSDNITLLIDPTNLALGVFKDGKIIIFNEKNPENAYYIKGQIY
ncbi:MAG: hypothetical protein HFJ48_07500 [Clostridia bacterium]|nr:hypothetical protein [Clostridia bacterium]